jgi:hypothetical protein
LYIHRQSLRHATDTRHDVQTGEVWRFAGPLDEASLTEAGAKFHQAMALQRATGEFSVDVLAHSGRLWGVNGRPVAGFQQLAIAGTAELPEGARIAAQWLEPLGDVDGHPLRVGQRDLSAAECAELRQIADSTWRRPLMPALLLTICCLPLLHSLLRNGHLPPDWRLHLTVALVAVIADIALVRAVGIARRMGRDLRDGMVKIIQRHSATPQAAPPQCVELLRHAGFPWTIEGEPAYWRKR